MDRFKQIGLMAQMAGQPADETGWRPSPAYVQGAKQQQIRQNWAVRQADPASQEYLSGTVDPSSDANAGALWSPGWDPQQQRLDAWQQAAQRSRMVEAARQESLRRAQFLRAHGWARGSNL